MDCIRYELGCVLILKNSKWMHFILIRTFLGRVSKFYKLALGKCRLALAICRAQFPILVQSRLFFGDFLSWDWKKLKGWKEKLFFRANREVLIKVVIQAIPTYSMSCFRLPGGLIKELETMIWKFWWGYSNEGRKIH